MNTIRTWNGRICELSDETYKITGKRKDSIIPKNDPLYGNGCLVRKISDSRGGAIGSHFLKGWATVCSVEQIKNNDDAHFVGIETKFLKKV